MRIDRLGWLVAVVLPAGCGAQPGLIDAGAPDSGFGADAGCFPCGDGVHPDWVCGDGAGSTFPLSAPGGCALHGFDDGLVVARDGSLSRNGSAVGTVTASPAYVMVSFAPDAGSRDLLCRGSSACR